MFSQLPKDPIIEDTEEYDESADDIIDHAIEIQKSDLDVINRSLGIVSNTKQIAEETKNALEDDTNKLNIISTDLDEIQDNTYNARKELRGIQKYMGRDKCFRIIMACIVLGIIAFIIVASIKAFKH